MDFNLFVFDQFAVFVLLFVLLLFACLVKLAKAVSNTALELALVFGVVGKEKFAFSVRLVVLPLAVVLNSLVLINLETSTLFFAIDPLSSIEVTICIQHRTVSMGYSIELLALVTIFFDNFA
jgi:hypothetical protein